MKQTRATIKTTDNDDCLNSTLADLRICAFKGELQAQCYQEYNSNSAKCWNHLQSEREQSQTCVAQTAQLPVKCGEELLSGKSTSECRDKITQLGQNCDLQAQVRQTSNKYWVSKKDEQWERALRFCKNWGGDLITINQPEELATISQHLKKNHLPSEKYWNGSKLKQSSTENEQCGIIGTTEPFLDSQPCEQRNKYICKKPIQVAAFAVSWTTPAQTETINGAPTFEYEPILETTQMLDLNKSTPTSMVLARIILPLLVSIVVVILGYFLYMRIRVSGATEQENASAPKESEKNESPKVPFDQTKNDSPMESVVCESDVKIGKKDSKE